jgi:hypothetical protein
MARYYPIDFHVMVDSAIESAELDPAVGRHLLKAALRQINSRLDCWDAARDSELDLTELQDLQSRLSTALRRTE